MVTEPEVTPELAAEYGLSENDFFTITSSLGRIPTYAEMRILAVYWSERYSWKSSSVVLKTLPGIGSKDLPQVIPVDDDLGLVIKMLSFHLSPREEGEKAASESVVKAVGEVQALGGHPISLFFSRHVGALSKRGTKKLARNLLKGARSSGAVLDIRSVASQSTFDEGYNTQCQCHTVVLGSVKEGFAVDSKPFTEGYPVFLLRGKEGKSETLSTEASVGRVCETLAPRGYLLGFRQVSLGGIAIASIEMALGSQSGIALNLKKIGVEENGMGALDILLSGKTGRFLLVINRGFERELRTICRQFEVDLARIGAVTGNGSFTVRSGRKRYCSIPLTVFLQRSEIPEHYLHAKEPSYLAKVRQSKVVGTKKTSSWESALLTLLGSENVLADEKGRLELDSLDSEISSPKKSIVFRTWGSGRYAYLDPRTGGKCAVMAAARKVVCRGATPRAAVVGFSVGDLHNPETFYLFREMVAGVAEACGALEIPVANKSMNYGSEESLPTPLGGVLGLMEKTDRFLTTGFKEPDDFILMLGSHRGELGGSEYSRIVKNLPDGAPPAADVAMERRIHEIILVMNKVGLIKSARDVSRGGFAVSLAQSLVASSAGLGARIHMSSKIGNDELLFGETQGLFLVTINEDSLIEIERVCMRRGVSCTAIGRVTDDGIFSFNDWIRMKVDRLKKLYSQKVKKVP